MVVLSVVSQGLAARTIGHRLGISSRTIERHLANSCVRPGM
ncbi:LuxR C-terminal-related transcriptional regulator [Microbacterium sp. ZW T2_14]